MSDLKIEWWPIDRPKPYAKNARKIPQRAVDLVAKSLREFGWQQAIVVDLEDVIIAGHTRLLAARQEGHTRVPVSVAAHLTPAQVRAYRLMDNRAHEETSWNDDILGIELGELKGLDLNLDLTGFNSRELARFKLDGDSQPAPEAQMDRAGELQAKWKVERGQIWQIGEHRLMCGDSTDRETVEALLGEVKPFLMVTDPPYGVSYDPNWRNVEAEKGNLAYAARRVGVVLNDERADWSSAWKLFPGDVVYSWHPPGATSLVHAKALQDSGFVIRMQIIWAKSNFPIGRGDYHVRHEPCWYAVRDGRPARRTDDRTQTTLWEINLDKNVEGGHSTQKPVECMERPIRNHERCDVYDPFLGSGTTMVAAQRQEARCFGIELHPPYCAVILERMSSMGLTPRLAACTMAADGRTSD